MTDFPPDLPEDDPSGPSGIAPGTTTGDVTAIRSTLATELGQLQRELDEIALLAQQAKMETERHEIRRVKGAERVAGLEREPRIDATELREAREQLLTLSRRATLFETQQQVLEAKQRTLGRFRDRISDVDTWLAAIDPGGARPLLPAVAASAGGRASGHTASAESLDRQALMRAQEDMRREIARQMHDGPAQSLANIALQSEIVQRLAGRGDPRAQAELEALRTMVQHALEATKSFIFDVRPMVLDDLGLVPTLRRTAIDRGRRASVDIDFDSQGTDRRLSLDLESGLFRIIDDAISGYLTLRPSRLVLHLDWAEQEVAATIRCAWLRDPAAREATPARQDTELREDLPPALRAMIEETRSDEMLARTAAHTLAPELVAALGERAADLGATLTLHDDGNTLELLVRTAS